MASKLELAVTMEVAVQSFLTSIIPGLKVKLKQFKRARHILNTSFTEGDCQSCSVGVKFSKAVAFIWPES